MAGSSHVPDIEAYRLLKTGRFRDALPFAERAVAAQRVCTPAHGLLATILVRLGRLDDAASVVTRAAELPTGIADAYDALAYVSNALGLHEQASALYRRAAAIAPQTPRFWYNLASSCRALGRLEEAESACDRAIACDRAEYPSYLLRAELRVQTPEFNHVLELEQRLGETGAAPRARMFLGYALGKELDDLGRFEEAFRWFDAAARARRSRLQCDIADDERKLARIAAVYTDAAEDAAPDDAAPSARVGGPESGQFIFIVGLPRSGTTLTERILNVLPHVRSNGETDNFSKSLLAAGDVAVALTTSVRALDIFERAALRPRLVG